MGKGIVLPQKVDFWLANARIRFFRLSYREKLLICLFVAALLGVWFSSLIGRHGVAKNDIRIANKQASDAGDWLLQEDDTAQNYSDLIQDINLGELPSVNEVNARIDEMIRKYGFGDFKINPPKSNGGNPLTFHTFTIDLGRANYNKLIEFTNDIKTSLPYVSLRQITIQAQRRTPQFLDVKLELKSIEYTP